MFGMTNTYETIIILDPSNHKDSAKVFRDMCQKFTKEYKIKEDYLGVKKLAYPLREKFTEGYYVMFVWMGTPENVAELERHMRIDDNVLKFLTVRNEEAGYELEEMPAADDAGKSEQSSYNPNSQVDALDVLLGFADYKKGVE
jgi:small subunit ribosomal protein S6